MRLAQKAKRLSDHEEEVQRVRNLRRSTEESLQSRMRQAITAAEFLIYQQHDEACYSELKSKEKEKERLVQEVESAKEDLVGFMRERKTLEKLEQKDAKQFEVRMEKLEQKMVDEEAVRRRVRK